MVIRTSLPRRLFKISPLVSFKPGAGVVYHPSVHDAHVNETLRQERAVKQGVKLPQVRKDAFYNGLDPDKVVTNDWQSLDVGRIPMRGGYAFAGYRFPQVKAFNEDELVRFFDCENFLNRYSPKEIWKSAKYRLRFTRLMYLSFLFPFTFVWAEFMWKSRYEPLETTIPTEDYHKHYVWHSLGHKLDHHAFVQYSEARRTHKWRNDQINPEDYIPPQYRNLQELPKGLVPSH
ncbi:conserved hypothetical protein [Theileria orientalis strain Shintoku]|uniref:Uncharacterized protein n=1 Tax=Theileria orientalis strain Shintoku TaxID=869250 RepID=J4DPR2_THEOR|nr:conserved hypothetical protein [Theileria orientalis strain Shintoku]PVC54372.1 hypothetical protein MACL_00003155 [Theileria orientalis]BAM41149.1 conserved hypothetical protein [Theileria orientalis strain Shintoku]|eukprot:XP_009691450.1 conserved hypothetical protein [Theileria orientalis strain Shintoku]